MELGIYRENLFNNHTPLRSFGTIQRDYYIYFLKKIFSSF